MRHRVIKASRHRGWIVFDLGFVVTAAVFAILGFVGMSRVLSSPPPTEQQVADEFIKSALAWVERIGPVGRDWNQAQRREALGWFLYRVAEGCNADPNFHAQRDFACEALEEYFPEIECWACEN